MPTLTPSRLPTEEQAFIDKEIGSRTGRPGSLLGVLVAVQERNPHKYLPADTLRYIAYKTETPLSQIYGVATFQALFNLQPQGDNTVCICRGTAFHTRGSGNQLQSAKKLLIFYSFVYFVSPSSYQKTAPLVIVGRA